MFDADELSELHWLLGIIQHLEIGLVVIDRNYQIKLWNGFMEEHSGLTPTMARGRNLFDTLPDLPEAWLRRKFEIVFQLNNNAWSIWQQRPWLTRFANTRPVTGKLKTMYQNITLFPLESVTGSVDHACMVIHDVSEMASNQLDLEQANLELARIGNIDGLTGLYNRRAWDSQMRAEWQRIQRYAGETTLIMLDIDHFKRVNDTWGHPAGDAVIQQVAQTISHFARQSDISGRYGGEEFALILPNTDLTGGHELAERLRGAIASQPILYNGNRIDITISLG
jgi:diguanylate cyclase